MNPLDDIPLNARSMSYRWDGYNWTLQVDGEHLTVAWRSPANAGETKTPLRNIKPELQMKKWVPVGAHKSARLSMMLLVAAVVVYYSDIRTHVPLLAPALLLLGLQYTYWFVRGAFPIEKTTIYDANGTDIISIPHFEQLTVQRKAFEQALVRMVERTRQDDAAA